jgi:putative addiction module component (TIGR02574 family)
MNAITLDEVLQLPVAERIRVVEAIWDSIADSPEAIELTDEQRAELDRRLDDLEKNPNDGPSWAEVRARIWPGKGRNGPVSAPKLKVISRSRLSGTRSSGLP